MRSLFRYTKQEKRGICFLLFLIAFLQILVYLANTKTPNNGVHVLFETDSLAMAFVDSAIRADQPERKDRPPKFNPNFITDYRGYLLGMKAEELDRLYAFRKEGLYVGSAEEFGRVTGVPDSLLQAIAPNFKFPDFRQEGREYKKTSGDLPEPSDLNTATAEELQTVSGIGPVLSARIVRFRESLGGFLVMEQLLDVYGLEEEVAKRAMKAFKIGRVPEVKKIDLNKAGVEELAGLVYLGRRLAHRIVAYRNAHGRIDSIAQLTKIEDFPADRISRIKLYLTL